MFLMPLKAFTQNEKNMFLKYSSWVLFQAVPSPVIYQNVLDNSNKINLGLRWQIIPLNYSFSANKFVPDFQSFYIVPVRRFAGSAEIFVQPELSFRDFNNGSIPNFWVSSGARVILPISSYGELLSASLGIKHNFYRKSDNRFTDNTGIEGGLYFMGGLGIQANYNFTEFNRFNIGLYIKYY
jgi:hypothetical protein